MATTYKILGQSVPTTTTNGTLYTVPNTSTQTVVSSITVCNTTNAPVDSYLYVVKGGSTAGTSNAVVYDVTLDAFSTTTLTLGLTLSNTSGTVDFIACGSGTASALTFQAFGSEIA
jgi:hypothetical protein